MNIKNTGYIRSVTINTEQHGEDLKPKAELKVDIAVPREHLPVFFGIAPQAPPESLLGQLFDMDGNALWPNLNPIVSHMVMEGVSMRVSGPDADGKATRASFSGLKLKDPRMTFGSPAHSMAMVKVHLSSVDPKGSQWALLAHWQRHDVTIELSLPDNATSNQSGLPLGGGPSGTKKPPAKKPAAKKPAKRVARKKAT